MPRTRVNLDKGWKFKQQDGPSDEWMPVASVPTQVHVDLLANKKIADPYQDLNELSVQWVGEKVWTYKVSFAAPKQSSGDAVTTDLVFEGLDTFATVTLNGSEILKADNMFVSYRVDVTEHIKHGAENLLEIVFDSALLRGRQLVEDHKHEHNFLVRQTEAGRLPVRKAQYNWGWDWGPILMTAGPWRPVYVEQYTARVDDCWAQNEVSADLGSCSGTIFTKVAGKTQKDDKIVVSLAKDGKVVFETEAVVGDSTILETPFRIEKPELWQPLGYGPQARYELRSRLVRGGQQELDSQSKLIGFRRTELVQEPDADGKSFYFRINGVDVFAGGSCWIPADNLLGQVPPQRYRDWVRLMAEGNQVMLRIWGGGVYEDDALLDACDEMGILLWHDFQFACGSYPTYPSYLENFEHEARQQVRRLRWHPSVVVWAGNNEDYQVQERYKLDYDYDGDKDPESWLRSTFPARYIYEHLLPKIVKEEDPFMIYHPSSPWGDGKDTADPTVGDIHQWNIWHGAMEKYQDAHRLGGRFVSEFGMISYPHVQTTERMITDPRQRRPGSMAMDFHNKAIGHARRIASYVADNFAQQQPAGDLAAYTHLTQAVQADTMREAYKAWRRAWGRPGARRCGGVLVWQLNDSWPTMSWAIVDYYLVRKPAWYTIANAMRPVDVAVARTLHDWTQTGHLVDENSGLRTGQVDLTEAARRGTFDVWVASSATSAVDAELTVRFISVRSGKDVAAAVTKTVAAAPNATTDAITQQAAPTSIPHPEDLTQRFDEAQYDPYVIHAVLSVAGAVVATDTAWPEPVKYLDLDDRGVSFKVAPSKDSVVVSARRPVKCFVFAEVEGMRLSDNGFDLVPGESKSVKVEGPLKADQLRFTYIGAPGSSLEIS